MFGSSPLGQLGWSDIVWSLVPSYYREKDVENGGYLKLLLESIAETFFSLREKARVLPLLRNAFEVDGGFNVVTITVSSQEVVQASDSETGDAYVIINTSDSLLDVSPGWVVGGAVRSVVRTVSAVGGYFTVAGSEVISGAITVRPPSMLEYLANDLGIEIDYHEPETYQRNLVARSHYWQARRGTESGLILRAKMAGFDASVYRLYRISTGVYESLPSGAKYEIPAGSEKYYTSIEPRLLVFDEIAADVIPLDEPSPAEYTESIVVSSVTGSSPNWVLHLASTPVGLVSDNATWKVVLGEHSYYLDSFTSSTWGVTAADHTPTTGTYTLEYSPRQVVTSSWKPSHLIRVELEIIEPDRLLDPKFLEEAITRLLAKLRKVVPAHVELAQVVFTLTPKMVLQIGTSMSGYYRQYGHFDEIPADEQATDTYEEIDL